jgi:cell pole-organizing protein PopZ
MTPTTAARPTGTALLTISYSSMRLFPSQPLLPKPNLSSEASRAGDADRLIAQDYPGALSQAGNQVAASAAPADPSMEAILTSLLRIMNEDEVAIPPPPDPVPKVAVPKLLDMTREGLVADQAQLPYPVPTNSPAEPDRSLIAPAVAAAAAASVGTLLQVVAAHRSSSAVTRGGPSIEDVVRAELRPMLKEWLDAHLPGIVERLVRIEIERVLGQTLS